MNREGSAVGGTMPSPTTGSSERAVSRLHMVKASMDEAEYRIHGISNIVARINQELVGDSGNSPSPPELTAEAAEKADCGSVGSLETAMLEIHEAISMLESLVKYQQTAGVVA